MTFKEAVIILVVLSPMALALGVVTKLVIDSMKKSN